jgi:transposase
MKHTTISVDLAKSIFEVAVSEQPGRVNERRRLSRARFLRFFAERQPALVVLEACGSAHYWGRQIQELGHEVLLLPPHATRPYVTRSKTDRADAKGLLEAHRNEDLHPVPVKSVEQQTLTALHRLRSRWLATRTARLNTVRGLLREFGITIPVGARNVVPRVRHLVDETESKLPEILRPVLLEACTEIRQLEQRLVAVERQLKLLARQIPIVKQLLAIPGIGVISATALVAFVGDVQRFPSGRHFASYLGLTPREYSSGRVRRLGKISKYGDVYLRMLLTHGARAVLWAAKRRGHPDRLRAWALKIERQRGHNKAAIALANKLARIVWAVWKHGHPYQEAQAA